MSDGVGLNITVHSYVDRMDFGLISDRESVPDLWHLVDLHIAEIERLFEATGAEWAVPQTAPPMRKGGDGVQPVAPRSQAVRDRIAAKGGVRERPANTGNITAARKVSAREATAHKATPNKAAPAKVAAKKASTKES